MKLKYKYKEHFNLSVFTSKNDHNKTVLSMRKISIDSPNN